MISVLIVAGDPSGDLVAAQLVLSLKKISPSLKVTAFGGQHLKAVSDHFVEDIVSQHALGFAIAPKKLFYFKSLLNDKIRPLLKNEKFDVVVPVDFYGFNCYLAKAAKEFGHRVYYYVSPQFWASRPWRVNRLKESVDKFLCLFPFEIEFYRSRGIQAAFVGHPLLDRIPEAGALSRPHVEPIVGLLPGSRPNEIRRHLPVMLDACKKISNESPGTRYLLFTVPHVARNTYLDIIEKHNNASFLIELIQDENYTWRSQLDYAITASGMETLENTFLGIPMVVMYKMDWLTFAIAKSLVSTPYVALPNILAKKFLVPEFIQHKATSDNISNALLFWIKNYHESKNVRSELLKLRDQFSGTGASDRAAKSILENVSLC